MSIPENKRDDIYFLTIDPSLLLMTHPNLGAKRFSDAELKKAYATNHRPDVDWEDFARRWGVGVTWVTDEALHGTFPARMAGVKDKDVWPLLRNAGTTQGRTFTGYLTRAGQLFEKPQNNTWWKITRPGYYGYYGGEFFDAIYNRYVLARPGKKRISNEFLNRVCHNAMKKVCGRDLPYVPTYFLFTDVIANNLITQKVFDGKDAVKNAVGRELSIVPRFTGQLFSLHDIHAVDPWRKMFAGIEHQVFAYGEGDTVQAGSDGKFAWPLGHRLPIAPTVGNIYTHFLQLYLAQIATDLGKAMLETPAWNSLDTNVAFAVVYPESAYSAHVCIGNYALYAGNGITYGHPEGPYAARLMLPDGTLSGAQFTALAQDVAAYANRERVAWIARNQGIYAKVKELIAGGRDIYSVAISELTDVQIVVTDQTTGVVQSNTATTEITGGAGEGAIVNSPATPGQILNVTNHTPSAANPLQIALTVVSQTPALSTPSPAYTGPTYVTASGGGMSISTGSVTNRATATTPDAVAVSTGEGGQPAQKSGSLFPIGVALAILSLLT